MPGKRKIKKQHEDAVHKSKNHEKNKSLMGLLERLGAPGKYPLFPTPLGGRRIITLATFTTSDFRILARSLLPNGA